MKNLLYLIFFSVNSFIFSQEIPNSGKNLNDFVPKNWRIFKQAEGDLNKDNKKDIALIIENTDPDNIFTNENLGSSIINTNPRYLLILFKSNNGYELKEINKTFIPSENDIESTCLADPLMDGFLEIRNGVLVLKLHYWLSCGSWYVTSNTYTFRFQKNEFELIGFDNMEFHRASGEMFETSINFSTKKMSITSGENMFEEDADGNKIESEEKTEWKTFKLDKLKNLKTLTVPMEWEFMDNFI